MSNQRGGWGTCRIKAKYKRERGGAVCKVILIHCSNTAFLDPLTTQSTLYYMSHLPHTHIHAIHTAIELPTCLLAPPPEPQPLLKAERVLYVDLTI